MNQCMKALYGGVTAGLASLLAVLSTVGTFGAVTAGQWVLVVISTVGGFGAVYGVTNSPPAVAPPPDGRDAQGRFARQGKVGQ